MAAHPIADGIDRYMSRDLGFAIEQHLPFTLHLFSSPLTHHPSSVTMIDVQQDQQAK
jgi:hypothetical protein